MVEKVKNGIYILNIDETPSDVSLEVYGDTYHVSGLLKHNPDSDWEAGASIVVPNRFGRVTTVEEGETTQELLKRMFPGQPTYLYVDAYLKWNAGCIAEDLVGRTIFVPER